MKVFSFILTVLIAFTLLSAGIHLTRTHKEHAIKIALEQENARLKREIHDTRIKTIVKDIRRVNSRIDEETAKKIAKAFIKYGKEFNIKIHRLLQIASVESRFNHRAINSVSGDYGLMQINWRVWGRRFAKSPKELLDIDKNVRVACAIMAYNKRIGFKRIGHYHSFNPEFVSVYEERLAPFSRRFAKTY